MPFKCQLSPPAPSTDSFSSSSFNPSSEQRFSSSPHHLVSASKPSFPPLAASSQPSNLRRLLTGQHVAEMLTGLTTASSDAGAVTNYNVWPVWAAVFSIIAPLVLGIFLQGTVSLKQHAKTGSLLMAISSLVQYVLTVVGWVVFLGGIFYQGRKPTDDLFTVVLVQCLAATMASGFFGATTVYFRHIWKKLLPSGRKHTGYEAGD
eukprot:GHVS01036165.1.p1 GENE.GHVS01036165.1~~GHVS01036165.1.p1  ORF type:complete len:239 (-),score=34.85 GHVS01036165.1:493-1107(-)